MARICKFIISAVVVFAVVNYLFSGADEEQLLVERLNEGISLAEIREQEHPIVMAQKASQLADFFTANPVFDLTNADYKIVQISSRKELINKILQVRKALGKLELAIRDPKVTLEKEKAKVNFEGSALGTYPGTEDQFLEIHRIRIFLEKNRKNWLVYKVEHLSNERGEG